jgi:hypothetical protein
MPHHQPPPSRAQSQYRPYPRAERRDPQQPSRAKQVREKILNVGEQFAGVLIDVAAEAVNEGVKSAVDTVLGRAERAASQAAETIGFVRKVRRAQEPRSGDGRDD